MAPWLEMLPEVLAELLARLIDGDIELSLLRPYHRISHTGHCRRYRVVVASCINDHNIRRKCVHEEAVACLVIAMMVGLDYIHLAADLGCRSLHISFA